MIYLVLLAIFAQLSFQQQQDPVNDFCRRFGHQTAVLGRKLYIDGGLVNYNNDMINSTSKLVLHDKKHGTSNNALPRHLFIVQRS